MPSIEVIRARILATTPLDAERTEAILDTYFRRVPVRVAYALERFPLADARVLDVGCSYGTSLMHFGRGSVGIDNSREAVEFCRALGLDARLADVDRDPPVTGERFDFLWVSDILEHLDAPRVLLRRLVAAAQPDGTLLLQTSALPSNSVASLILRSRGRQPFDADVHYHQWTKNTITHLLARAGWRVKSLLVPRPHGLRHVEPLLRPSFAPRLLVVAEVDPDLVASADRAEMRNRQSG